MSKKSINLILLVLIVAVLVVGAATTGPKLLDKYQGGLLGDSSEQAEIISNQTQSASADIDTNPKEPEEDAIVENQTETSSSTAEKEEALKELFSSEQADEFTEDVTKELEKVLGEAQEKTKEKVTEVVEQETEKIKESTHNTTCKVLVETVASMCGE